MTAKLGTTILNLQIGTTSTNNVLNIDTLIFRGSANRYRSVCGTGFISGDGDLINGRPKDIQGASSVKMTKTFEKCGKKQFDFRLSFTAL